MRKYLPDFEFHAYFDGPACLMFITTISFQEKKLRIFAKEEFNKKKKWCKSAPFLSPQMLAHSGFQKNESYCWNGGWLCGEKAQTRSCGLQKSGPGSVGVIFVRRIFNHLPLRTLLHHVANFWRLVNLQFFRSAKQLKIVMKFERKDWSWGNLKMIPT